MCVEPRTLACIRASVAEHGDRLWAAWARGRPEGWKADDRTRLMVVIGFWLAEELTRFRLTPEDVKLLEQVFHRRSRSEEDLIQIAKDVLDAAATGAIDRDRVPHRRWG